MTKAKTKSKSETTSAPPPSDCASAAPVYAAVVAHQAAGRLRLRLSRAATTEELHHLVERIGALPGVRRVRARPNTGSVIIEDDRPLGGAAEMLTAEGVFKLAPPARTPPLGQSAQLGLARLDMEISKGTEGALDFRSALATLLILGAVVQAARGRVAGPATTLALSALSLLEPPKR